MRSGCEVVFCGCEVVFGWSEVVMKCFFVVVKWFLNFHGFFWLGPDVVSVQACMVWIQIGAVA